MDPNCRRDMPDRYEANNMQQQPQMQYQVNDQMDYGEESAPRQSSNARFGQESASPYTKSAYSKEQSTLKK